MTLKTLFVPGPYDALASHLTTALGPDGNMASLDYWPPSDNASQLANRSEALVLGPGAEAAFELASEDGDVRLVQFTGCRQSSETVEALRASGMIVANAGPALAPFVAEHTLSLIRAALALAGRSEHQVGDLVVGIVGLGNVGIEVARRLREEGSTIVYHDVRTVAQGYADEVGARRQSLDRLLVDSDVVTLHISDTPHTPELIGDRELRLMKPGAVLVNTSRSEAIDEEAVASALDSGKLGSVALGVVRINPDGRPGPLLDHDRVVVETEDATELDAALKAVAALVADNLRRIEAGETPRGLMDPAGFPAVGDPAFWSSRLTPRRPA